MDTEFQNQFAQKLGIISPRILRKAAELSRLINVKAPGICMSDSCKNVMSIELACMSYSQNLDRAVAAKLAGTTKAIYNRTLKVLETLLNLAPKTNVQDLAIQFGCSSECSDLAGKVLKSYQNRMSTIDLDMALYQTAALYVTSKKLKSKVDKSKLVSIAGCTSTTFDRMCKLLENHVDILVDDKKQLIGTKRPAKSFLQSVEESIKRDELQTNSKKQKDSSQDGKADDYEAWKRRMLDMSRD
ncbi:PREDICTED: origin recognition complex subunit 6-like [Priapulus caudatus]|uniref:Origin recognition complex subunit 6-like n=1 Tax=Priapulus caudatus TaxID=37621 RepID=A0ABM1ES25_PRICU|nr:PREDICTED: origin recognition complex subunit 6-like [Priapulus caudatus]